MNRDREEGKVARNSTLEMCFNRKGVTPVFCLVVGTDLLQYFCYNSEERETMWKSMSSCLRDVRRQFETSQLDTAKIGADVAHFEIAITYCCKSRRQTKPIHTQLNWYDEVIQFW